METWATKTTPDPKPLPFSPKTFINALVTTSLGVRDRDTSFSQNVSKKNQNCTDDQEERHMDRFGYQLRPLS